VSRPLAADRTEIWSARVAVVALSLAAVVDGISDNWVHGVLLGGAAVAVAVDARKARPGRPLLRAALTPVAGLLLVAAALTYAVGVGGFRRYTWPVTVAVVVPGVAALVLAWRGPLRARPVPPRHRGGWLWAIVLVAGGLWELQALLLQPSLQVSSQAHPTISTLMDSVLASWPGRSVTLAVWLALGWYLLGSATLQEP
jgi:hypothetical protein